MWEAQQVSTVSQAPSRCSCAPSRKAAAPPEGPGTALHVLRAPPTPKAGGSILTCWAPHGGREVGCSSVVFSECVELCPAQHNSATMFYHPQS